MAEIKPDKPGPSDPHVSSNPSKHRQVRRRHRLLQATAILPSLATVLNGLSGFGAIHYASKLALGDNSPQAMINLMIACGLIGLAMVFDMLDGRLARMTRRTSDFGAQLDSLCDVISFGLAPAFLMLHAVVALLRDPQTALPYAINTERLVWCVAAVYLACATLRLARFNVENEPDESAHMNFKGLPSPGAAACVVAWVLLYAWHAPLEGAASITMAIVLPAVTLICGLLMVSRFRYGHIVNQYIRGKRPFAYLVRVVVILVAMLMWPFVTIVAFTTAYALFGPIGAIWRWRRERNLKPPAQV